ncbi:hypothetical protein F4859DRAFT_495131 [Xylaria cf. heliscus]|nr:hypothetical protein F4859DRAFT_495131 [Xylaria cf. heliscus]
MQNVTAAGALVGNTDYPNIPAPTNTLIMCCPSGFTGDVNGGCYSTMASKTLTSSTSTDYQTEVCIYQTPEEDITTISATTILASIPSPKWSITAVVSVTEVREIVPTTATVDGYLAAAVTYVPGVMLMHAPSDLLNAAPSFVDARPPVYLLLLLWLLVFLA